jgi:hypothetical protein
MVGGWNQEIGLYPYAAACLIYRGYSIVLVIILMRMSKDRGNPGYDVAPDAATHTSYPVFTGRMNRESCVMHHVMLATTTQILTNGVLTARHPRSPIGDSQRRYIRHDDVHPRVNPLRFIAYLTVQLTEEKHPPDQPAI